MSIPTSTADPPARWRRQPGRAAAAIGALALLFAACGSDATESGTTEPDPTEPPTVFATGANPYRIAFDGTDIWITHPDADTVTRLDPVDGTRDELGTDVGPDQLAFDGTHIRITHPDADTVSRLNPAAGSRRGVAVAAGFVWVAGAGDDTVSRIDPSSIGDLTSESGDSSTLPTDTTG